MKEKSYYYNKYLTNALTFNNSKKYRRNNIRNGEKSSIKYNI